MVEGNGSGQQERMLRLMDTASIPGNMLNAASAHPSSFWSGERCLWLAVLEDAIEVYRKSLTGNLTILTDLDVTATIDWLFNDYAKWIGSFEYVCDLVDLNPGVIREGLIVLAKHLVEERHRAFISEDIRDLPRFVGDGDTHRNGQS